MCFYLPIERIPLTCLTWLNSPMTFFSACFLCSSFIGADLPPTTSATWATNPLSTYRKFQSDYIHILSTHKKKRNPHKTQKQEEKKKIPLHIIYPEEVIGVITPETNELKNVVNGYGCDIWVEPEFDIAIICLRKFKNMNFELPINGYAPNY